jgi:hypothetical protein
MIRNVTPAMDNVVAWRLGEIAREAAKGPAGDLIDTGLLLCRLLHDKGFVLGYGGPEFSGSHDAIAAQPDKS